MTAALGYVQRHRRAHARMPTYSATTGCCPRAAGRAELVGVAARWSARTGWSKTGSGVAAGLEAPSSRRFGQRGPGCSVLGRRADQPVPVQAGPPHLLAWM